MEGIDYLRDWRRRRGITQQEAGDLIGAKYRTWANWETEGRGVPDYVVLLLRYMDKYPEGL